jgi:uridine phosphorylase
METSGIYGLGKILGHHCISLSAIVANRVSKQFSKNGHKTVEQLITKCVDIISGIQN